MNERLGSTDVSAKSGGDVDLRGEEEGGVKIQHRHREEVIKSEVEMKNHTKPNLLKHLY